MKVYKQLWFKTIVIVICHEAEILLKLALNTNQSICVMIFIFTDAMLATQLNNLMDSGEMDSLSVVQVDKYLCNTIQGDRFVLSVSHLNLLL